MCHTQHARSKTRHKQSNSRPSHIDRFLHSYNNPRSVSLFPLRVCVRVFLCVCVLSILEKHNSRHKPPLRHTFFLFFFRVFFVATERSDAPPTPHTQHPAHTLPSATTPTDRPPHPPLSPRPLHAPQMNARDRDGPLFVPSEPPTTTTTTSTPATPATSPGSGRRHTHTHSRDREHRRGHRHGSHRAADAPEPQRTADGFVVPLPEAAPAPAPAPVHDRAGASAPSTTSAPLGAGSKWPSVPSAYAPRRPALKLPPVDPDVSAPAPPSAASHSSGGSSSSGTNNTNNPSYDALADDFMRSLSRSATALPPPAALNSPRAERHAPAGGAGAAAPALMPPPALVPHRHSPAPLRNRVPAVPAVDTARAPVDDLGAAAGQKQRRRASQEYGHASPVALAGYGDYAGAEGAGVGGQSSLPATPSGAASLSGVPGLFYPQQQPAAASAVAAAREYDYVPRARHPFERDGARFHASMSALPAVPSQDFGAAYDDVGPEAARGEWAVPDDEEDDGDDAEPVSSEDEDENDDDDEFVVRVEPEEEDEDDAAADDRREDDQEDEQVEEEQVEPEEEEEVQEQEEEDEDDGVSPRYAERIDDGYYTKEEARKYERRPPRVPAEENVTINWQKGKAIGSGAYGTVYLGMNVDTGKLLAVKTIPIVRLEEDSKELKSFRAEVDMMRGLHHENIVKYLGTEVTADSLNILLEYIPCGSIASLVKKIGALGEQILRIYTRQILSGLMYLHNYHIVHRDVKGSNILVDHTGVIKLTDFGASKRLEELVSANGTQSLKGTPNWMAPEVITKNIYCRQNDIWGVGCTIIEMATGKPPWSDHKDQMSVLFAIAQAKAPPPFPPALTPVGKDFLALCLRVDHRARPNAATLLRHPWMQGLNTKTTEDDDKDGLQAQSQPPSQQPQELPQQPQQQQQPQPRARPVPTKSPSAYNSPAQGFLSLTASLPAGPAAPGSGLLSDTADPLMIPGIGAAPPAYGPRPHGARAQFSRPPSRNSMALDGLDIGADFGDFAEPAAPYRQGSLRAVPRDMFAAPPSPAPVRNGLSMSQQYAPLPSPKLAPADGWPPYTGNSVSGLTTLTAEEPRSMRRRSVNLGHSLGLGGSLSLQSFDPQPPQPPPMQPPAAREFIQQASPAPLRYRPQPPAFYQQHMRTASNGAPYVYPPDIEPDPAYALGPDPGASAY